LGGHGGLLLAALGSLHFRRVPALQRIKFRPPPEMVAGERREREDKQKQPHRSYLATDEIQIFQTNTKPFPSSCIHL